MLGQPMSMLIRRSSACACTDGLPRVRPRPISSSRSRTCSAEGGRRQVREYFRPGPGILPLADRATLANMAPEYGATARIFPVTAQASSTCASRTAPRNWSR